MSLVIQIVGLVDAVRVGVRSPFDGEYLKEYDPDRPGISPDGRPMVAHIVTTPNVEEAIQFPSLEEAHECWTRVDPEYPTRADGKPNRPLTAFTVTFVDRDRVQP